MNTEDSVRLYTFYETPVFTSKLAQVAGENELPILYVIQADLIADPLRWPMVKGTGGARKGRVADPGGDKGKSGSFRYYVSVPGTLRSDLPALPVRQIWAGRFECRSEENDCGHDRGNQEG